MGLIGATLVAVGLGQVLCQLYLLHILGHWSAITLGDYLGRHGELPLSAEVSLLMTVVGCVLLLAGPFGHVFRSYRRPAVKQSTVS